MTAIFMMLVLGVLIFLEKKGKINISNMGGSLFLAVGNCLLFGLYAIEILRLCLCLFIHYAGGFGDEYNKSLDYLLGGKLNTSSAAWVIIQLLLLVTLSVPFLVGTVYIIQKIIRHPVKKQAYETDAGYCGRCALRVCTLGSVMSLVLIGIVVVMVLCVMPFIDMFVKSLLLFHPLVIFIVMLFTAGFGIIILCSTFFLVNSPLIVIMCTFALICMALYVYTVSFGISAAVRAKKLGVITLGKAFVYGALSFMLLWNIIPYLVLRSKIKSHSCG